jgi:PAS domain S-box-containing protein
MVGQGSTALQKAELIQDMLDAPASPVNRGEYAALILDRLGRIFSCGAPAEKMFGTYQAQLKGRWISELIAGLLRGDSSPSYGARYLVYLCADGEWRKFKATDAGGHEFTVELNLAQMVTEGREMFLLNVRRAGDMT